MIDLQAESGCGLTLRYYTIYDGDNREKLFEAYSEDVSYYLHPLLNFTHSLSLSLSSISRQSSPSQQPSTSLKGTLNCELSALHRLVQLVLITCL